MAVGKAVLDRHVSALDKAGLLQPLMQGRKSFILCIPRLTAEDADHRQPGLLRPPERRPSDDGTAEKCNELAPPHGHSMLRSIFCAGRLDISQTSCCGD